MRILFTGGATGGHITPIIAIARQLKKINPKIKLYFLGAKSPVGFGDIFQKEKIKTKIILAGKFRRYFSFKIFLDLIKIPISIFQSLYYIFMWMPDVIFSKGGYGSAPVVIVGWVFHIPIITHESDTIPGIATRLGGKLSKRIAVSFNKTKNYFPSKKTALLGNPIRLNIISSNQNNKESNQKPVILVIGGSQGAQQIDKIILSILPQIFGKYKIIHQCRPEAYEEIKQQTKSIDNYSLFSFLSENQLKAAFALADVVVSRAGSTSIFEIAACGKPSILIPLMNSSFDHQRENAFTYAEAGASIVIEEVNLTPNILLNQINKIINNSILAKQMSNNARKFAILEAGQKIAEELIKLGE